MKRLKTWALGIIGTSVLTVLGITLCSKKALSNEEIIDVYGPPPPSTYVDSLDNEETEVIDSNDTTRTTKEKRNEE